MTVKIMFGLGAAVLVGLIALFIFCALRIAAQEDQRMGIEEKTHDRK